MVVWGDHGWKLENMAWCKHTNVRLDTRSPLIMVAPQQKSVGKAIASPVEFVDIYQHELAGLKNLDTLKVTALLSFFKTQVASEACCVFTISTREYYGLFNDNRSFRYTVWLDQKKGNKVVSELYDHQEMDKKMKTSSIPPYVPDMNTSGMAF